MSRLVSKLTARAQIIIALIFLSSAWAADKSRLLDQVLAARTMAIIAHVGRVPAASDLKRESRLKTEAEEELRKEHYLEVVNEPDKADLVFLLLGWPGVFRDTEEVIGVVVPGGQQPHWSAMPLWIGERNRARDVINNFHDYLKRGGKSRLQSPVQMQAPELQSRDEKPSSAMDGNMPRSIAAAQTLSLLYFFPDRPAGSASAEPPTRTMPAGFTVEHSLRKWGRFELIENPEKADLIIAVYRDWWDYDWVGKVLGIRDEDRGRQALLIFRGGQTPDWTRMPLWMEQAHDWKVAKGEYYQPDLVQRLRRDVEKAEQENKSSTTPKQSIPLNATPSSSTIDLEQERAFVFVQRTFRHAEYSSPEVFHDVLKDLLAYFESKNVAIATDQSGGLLHAERLTPLDTIFTVARDANAKRVLYVVVDRPITQWIKITVQCFDMERNELWKEEAANGGGLSGRKGFEVSMRTLHMQLDKRVGQEGLPVPSITNELVEP